MVRILMIGMHDKIGGVETFLMNYYRNIDRSKIQFDFINMFDKLCFQDEIIELGGKIYQVPNVKRHPIKYYKKLKEIVRINEYEIVHINMLSMANVLPILAAKKAKAKHIIAHSHNTNTPKGILRKTLDKLNKNMVLKNATDLFACSKLAGNWMFGEKREVTIINNAIDLNRYIFNNDERDKIRKKLNVENKFVVGHIGRFSEQKNHKFLIDVFKEIALKEKDAILLLIGEGNLKDNIKNKVKEYELNDKVIFLDIVDNAYDYYQAMDVFVLPSLFEGLPVVGIEAQASGTYCLFSDSITKEVKIVDDVEFISIDDKEKWANEILKCKDKNKRKYSIQNEYNIEYAAKRLEKIYLEM